MEVKSDVLTITKLSDYFFVVPDYQREYVWKAEDHVERFLEDIDNEAVSKQSYFIGSIIVVKNDNGKFDVIDGQQRLTTIVITLCALRNLLQGLDVKDEKSSNILKTIEELLYKYDIETMSYNIRLELQYDESKDYLTKLIKQIEFNDHATPSITRMKEAYETILSFYTNKLEKEGVDRTLEDIRYLLTKVELVVIKSENLSSALKIFETINQRGSGLNAMDLIKNLLFSNVVDSDFSAIKEVWKQIPKNLQDCKEDNSPMRFLRYFFLARYYDENDPLREDGIYKWLISDVGKKATQYESRPLEFAKELAAFSKRYSLMVNATEKCSDEVYKNVANIGSMNKYKSRQHLILLLALHQNCSIEVMEYLASQIESYFFYCVTMHVQAKDHERYFSRWAKLLRNKSSMEDIVNIVEDTFVPHLKQRLAEFKSAFMVVRHDQYNPLYRQRYVLSKFEQAFTKLCNLPSVVNLSDCHVEHILPQTPKNENYVGFTDQTEYHTWVYRLGNVTLLEGTLNQAINKCNDLTSNWYQQKQQEYCKSAITMTRLLNPAFTIGTNTAINKFKADKKYVFASWDTKAIELRQRILMDIALSTWTFNGRSLEQ